MTEQALPPGNVDAPADANADRIKRRQYLLLAGIAGVIVAGTVLSVSLTGSGTSSDPAPRPKSTNILSPGAQVDPRDAWRGQADAQLRAIEQRSRELTQRGSELDGQSRDSALDARQPRRLREADERPCPDRGLDPPLELYCW